MHLRLIASVLLATLLPSLATLGTAWAAPTVLQQGHVDIGLGYDPLDGWDLHVHDEENDVEYEPDEAIFFGGPDTRVAQPADPQFAFTGASPDDDLWVLPEVQEPGQIFLGFGAEESAPGVFDSYAPNDPRVGGAAEWIEVRLVAVRGPGQVSVFQVDQFGSPVLWMATSDGLDDSDATWVEAGGERHMNWAFTAAGCYELDFVSSALIGGVPVVSDVTTYQFGIECVPEPSTACLALLGGAAVALGISRRRRQ